MNKNIDKLESIAEKLRERIKLKQNSIKKDTEKLKTIESEIENLKGQQFRNDINRLNLTPEEFENFRKVVLSSKDNLLDVINKMSEMSAHVPNPESTQDRFEQYEQKEKNNHMRADFISNLCISYFSIYIFSHSDVHNGKQSF